MKKSMTLKVPDWGEFEAEFYRRNPEAKTLKWNCHPAACALAAMIPESRVARGHWVGPVEGRGSGIIQHSWVEVCWIHGNRYDYTIIDPTSWVMMDEIPGILVDEYRENYHLGSVGISPALWPMIKREEQEEVYQLKDWTKGLIKELRKSLPFNAERCGITRKELAHLCRHFDPRSVHAPELYARCGRIGKAIVPIDLQFYYEKEIHEFS